MDTILNQRYRGRCSTLFSARVQVAALDDVCLGHPLPRERNLTVPYACIIPFTSATARVSLVIPMPNWWYWGRGKMAAILQTTFSRHSVNEDVRISIEILPKCPTDNKSSLFQRNGLASIRRQAITLTNADPVQWLIYVPSGLNMLTRFVPMMSVILQ